MIHVCIIPWPLGTSLVKVTDTKAQWGLKNCNLLNVQSGASLSIQKKKRGYAVKGGIQYDGDSLLQRFNLGLSCELEHLLKSTYKL